MPKRRTKTVRRHAYRSRTGSRTRIMRRRGIFAHTRVYSGITSRSSLGALSTVQNLTAPVTPTNLSLAFLFRLSDLPNYNEFTSLYDQYKIVGVKVTFYPQQTDDPVTGSGVTTAILHTAIDRNDATILGGESDILQYGNVKTHKFNTKFSIYVRPKVAVTVWNTNATSGYAQGGSIWLDSSSPDVQYYGLKVVIPGVTAGAVSGWRIYCKYYMKFRDVI